MIDANLREFVNEAEEICTRIFDALLRAEHARDAAAVDALYRDVHTLKGLAQAFGVSGIEPLADALELALESARADLAVMDEAFVELQLVRVGDITKQMADIKLGLSAPAPIASGPADSRTDAADWTLKKLAPLPDAPVAFLAPAPAPAPMPMPIAVVTPTPELTLAPTPAAEVAAPVAATADAGSTAAAADTVRVSVALLDRLMLLVGEMVLVRNQVLQYAVGQDDFAFSNLSQRLDQVTSEVQGEVMKTRMQPIGNVLTRFQRVIRDLSRDLNKKLEIELGGVETEVDKALLEAIKDPLMHIVRNSCDHGIENPAERRLAGKPETGKIKVDAYQEGDQVIIRVSDDGRGLNRAKLVAKAVEKNIITAERGAEMTDREAFALIFAAGFSTAAQVTNVSGRGVGMDVVRSNIEKVGGTVELDSTLGRGMTLRLKIPLTLAIVPALIVRCGTNGYAVPQGKLVELLRFDANATQSRIEQLHGKPFLRLRGRLLPLIDLRDVLDWSADHRLAIPAGDAVNIAILQSEECTFGLIVDEIQDSADIVVKPLSTFLKSLGAYSGATVLGNGSVALILDVASIAQRHKLSAPAHTGLDTRNDEAAHLNELQEFLMFSLGTSAIKYALPLTLVHRLEEFAITRLEVSGNQSVVRYGESILPIISLNGLVNSVVPEREADTLPVIVIKKSERLFGLRVGDILDVLATTDSMDDFATDRPSILGNLVTAEGVVVVIDVLRIVDDILAVQSGRPVSTTRELGGIKGGGKILFAEDTNFFRKHVTAVLEKAGYEITQARDGREAADLLDNSPAGTFDLLLTDIEMPRMNGFELVEFARAHDVWGQVPAMALTTRVSPEHIEKGKLAGFDRYLEKMNAEVLLGEIRAVLKSAGARRVA